MDWSIQFFAEKAENNRIFLFCIPIAVSNLCKFGSVTK